SERTGSCLCGHIKYRLTSEPVAVAVCWCRDCQRIASNGSVNAIVPNAAIEVTGGLAEYESDAASGGQLRYRFCHRCGSHLFGNSTTAPDLTVGQRYEVRLVSFAAIKESAHRALQPFGQIPTYQEGDLALFESGAIVLHVAERHAGLLPQDPDARARAAAWMFAAVGTVEPPIVAREA